MKSNLDLLRFLWGRFSIDLLAQSDIEFGLTLTFNTDTANGS